MSRLAGLMMRIRPQESEQIGASNLIDTTQEPDSPTATALPQQRQEPQVSRLSGLMSRLEGRQSVMRPEEEIAPEPPITEQTPVTPEPPQPEIDQFQATLADAERAAMEATQKVETLRTSVPEQSEAISKAEWESRKAMKHLEDVQFGQRMAEHGANVLEKDDPMLAILRPLAQLGNDFFVKPARGLAQTAILPGKQVLKLAQHLNPDSQELQDIQKLVNQIDQPTAIERELDADFQERLNKSLEDGKIGNAAYQIVTEGGLSMATGLMQIMMLGSAIGGEAGGGALVVPGISKTKKAIMSNAVLRGAYSYLTTPGTAKDKSLAGLITTLYMSTPAVAQNFKMAGLADLGANTIISALTGAYGDAYKQAEIQAEKSGKPEDVIPLFVANALPTFFSDMLASSGTKYKGDVAKSIRANLPKMSAYDKQEAQSILKDLEGSQKFYQQSATESLLDAFTELRITDTKVADRVSDTIVKSIGKSADAGTADDVAAQLRLQEARLKEDAATGREMSPEADVRVADVLNRIKSNLEKNKKQTNNPEEIKSFDELARRIDERIMAEEDRVKYGAAIDEGERLSEEQMRQAELQEQERAERKIPKTLETKEEKALRELEHEEQFAPKVKEVEDAIRVREAEKIPLEEPSRDSKEMERQIREQAPKEIQEEGQRIPAKEEIGPIEEFNKGLQAIAAQTVSTGKVPIINDRGEIIGWTKGVKYTDDYEGWTKVEAKRLESALKRIKEGKKLTPLQESVVEKAQASPKKATGGIPETEEEKYDAYVREADKGTFQSTESDISEGDLVRRNGEWYKASPHEDGTTLKDGVKKELNFDEQFTGLVIKTNDPDYQKALSEFREQESQKAETKPKKPTKPKPEGELLAPEEGKMQKPPERGKAPKAQVEPQEIMGDLGKAKQTKEKVQAEKSAEKFFDEKTKHQPLEYDKDGGIKPPPLPKEVKESMMSKQAELAETRMPSQKMADTKTTPIDDRSVESKGGFVALPSNASKTAKATNAVSKPLVSVAPALKTGVLDVFRKERDAFDGSQNWALEKVAQAYRVRKEKLNSRAWEKIGLYIRYKDAPELVEKYYDKVPKHVQKLLDDIKSMTADEKKEADLLIQEWQDWAKVLKSQGLLDKESDDYITQVTLPMTQKDISKQRISRSRFGVKSGYSKQRKFKDGVLEVLASEGYKPSTLDAAKLMRIYQESMIKAQTERAFVDVLKEMIGPDGDRALRPASEVKNNDDYVRIDHPALTKYKLGFIHRTGSESNEFEIFAKGASKDTSPFKRMMEDELMWDTIELYAHKSIASKLNALLSKSAIRQQQGLKQLLKLNATGKYAILSFSGFHHIALAKTAAAYKVINHHKGLELLVKNDPIVMQGVKKGGLTLSASDQQRFAKNVANEALQAMDKVTGLKSVGKAWLGAKEWWDNGLWDRYYVGLKAASYKMEFERNMNRYASDLAKGKKTEAEVHKITARDINDNFGGLNTRRMELSAGSMDVMRLMLLAPDWTLSNWRFFGRAAKLPGLPSVMDIYDAFRKAGQLPKDPHHPRTSLFRNLEKPKDTSKGAAGYMGKVIMFIGGMTALINKASNDEWLPTDNELWYMAQLPDDMFMDEMGRARYIDLFGHFFEPIKALKDPLRWWAGKKSFAIGRMQDLYNRKNWRGDYIGNVGDLKKGHLYRSKYEDDPGGWGTVPSMAIHQATAFAPIPAKAVFEGAIGEQTPFDAFGKVSGLPVVRGKAFGWIKNEKERRKFARKQGTRLKKIEKLYKDNPAGYKKAIKAEKARMVMLKRAHKK